MTLLLTVALFFHTTAELTDWYSVWLSTPETSDIKVELLRDMEARHPCFPEVCQLEEVMPTADYVGAVATPPPANSGMGTNVEQWRNLVAAYFPAEHVDRMLRIMACESGGNPNAYNGSTGVAGLFQIHPLWQKPWPGDYYDPWTNVAVAYQVWLEQGYRAWVCRG